MIRRPPRSTRVRSSAASDVYKRQIVGPGGAFEGGEPVLQGSEVQERRDGFPGGYGPPMPRVVDQREDAVVDLAIALHRLLAFIARQLPDLVDVAAQRIGEVVEIERQQLRVRQAHHAGTGGL